jgi:Na+/proline symporter
MGPPPAYGQANIQQMYVTPQGGVVVQPYNGQQVPIVVMQQPSDYNENLGMIFFIIGFVLPVVWIVGAFVPSGQNLSQTARNWRNVNRVMATLVTTCCGCYIILMIISAATRSSESASQATAPNRSNSTTRAV